MSKKPTTTKEAMVEAAFLLVREKGHAYLTVRNLAASLGCSTQPIMYQFPTLEILKEQTYQKANAFHTEYLLEGEDLLEIGLRYIQFAKDEPRLFRFLFQSNRFSGLSLDDLIHTSETDGIINVVSAENGLDPEAAVAFFEPLVAVVHGYASLIANNAMKYDPDAVRTSLVAIANGLLRGMESL